MEYQSNIYIYIYIYAHTYARLIISHWVFLEITAERIISSALDLGVCMLPLKVVLFAIILLEYHGAET